MQSLEKFIQKDLSPKLYKRRHVKSGVPLVQYLPMNNEFVKKKIDKNRPMMSSF